MRLAFVNSTRRWGGVKTWCMDMALAAQDKGHTALIYGRDERFVEAGLNANIPSRIMRFGADFNPASIAAFYKEFRQQSVTHVIVNVGKDLRTAGVAARLLGLPLIIHVGAPADFSHSFLRRLVHLVLQPSYVCCSEFTRRSIIANVPWLASARTVAIHPGTLMPFAPPCLSRQPYTFITTSQLTAPKRHIDLIYACALLTAHQAAFKLRIVGSGDQEDALKALVAALNLQDYIEFRGYVSNVADELRQADIFILPTDAEPLGIALEEAMAHGLFPVARNSGGVPEIWPSAFFSELLPPQAAPHDFATLLLSLLTLAPRELDVRRLAVQDHARFSFSRVAQFEELETFLEGLCHSKTSRPKHFTK